MKVAHVHRNVRVALPIGRFLWVTIILIVCMLGSVNAEEDGESIFRTTCATCHASVGMGKLVGPDLKDVEKRHSVDWIMKFVKSSQAMVKQGDEAAVKLFNDYNKIIMPDQPLNDEEILAVLEFIKQESEKADNADEILAEEPIVSSTASERASNSGASSIGFDNWLLLLIVGVLLSIIALLARIIHRLAQDITAKKLGK